jgi:5-methylcytosine-specific restriction protein A
LEENDYCRRCGSHEHLSVDHIIDPRGNEEMFFDENNLQTLCVECHRIKTAYEIQNRKKGH